MKPNDEAYQAAIAEGKRWETGSYYSAGRQNSSCHSVLRQDGENRAFDVVAEFNNHKDRDEALDRLRAEAMVDAAYAAQFKSGGYYAGLIEALRKGHVRYAAETQDEAAIRRNKERAEAADALEAVLAERDAWKRSE